MKLDYEPIPPKDGSRRQAMRVVIGLGAMLLPMMLIVLLAALMLKTCTPWGVR